MFNHQQLTLSAVTQGLRQSLPQYEVKKKKKQVFVKPCLLFVLSKSIQFPWHLVILLKERWLENMVETTSNDDVFISGYPGNCHDATKTTIQVRDHLVYTFDIPLFIYMECHWSTSWSSRELCFHYGVIELNFHDRVLLACRSFLE